MATSWLRSIAQKWARTLPTCSQMAGFDLVRGMVTATHASSTMKVYKPTSPGMRGRVITRRDGLWKGKPWKALTEGMKRIGGRNNAGRTTVWHRGGGHKRVYRKVDFKRQLWDVTGNVERIEYDPNRSARIALVDYGETHKKAYIIAPDGLKPGDVVQAGPSAGIQLGNALPLSSMPIGTIVHNVEMVPKRGGQLARAAGTHATLLKKGEDGYALIKLSSGEQRKVLNGCMATVGTVSNKDHSNRKLGKAGAKRWLGRRPVVRGVAMNPIDHPHGGGEGKTSGGRPSVTPWGKPTKGKRTRNNPRTDKFIQLSRHKAKRKRG